jgi:AAA domain
MTRSFETTQAARKQVNLIIGLVGPSSSGKTWTALELATGIQEITGGDIEMIDTEHERGLFYADNFKFNHTSFSAPFASVDYLAAIQQAAKRAKIVIVDSMSHEHEGEGGMIDFQEQELTRMTRGDEGKRQALQMLAWAKPKAARRRLLQGLTQIDAHLILCFRAKNSSKPGKDGNGKNVVIPMGFVPIAGEEFVFESALSVLFHPNARGVPSWSPDLPGERVAVKLPQQFAWIADKSGPLTRQDGVRLAKWAKGGVAAPKAAPPAEEPSDTPIGNDPDVSTEAYAFAEELEFSIDTATDAKEASQAFNAAMKTPLWALLKTEDAGRAAELKAKAVAKINALKGLVEA